MKKRLWLTIFLVMILTTLSALPVFAASRILPGIKISEKKGSTDFTYSCYIQLEKKAKIGSAPSLSGSILLPKALLSEKGVFWINTHLDLHDPKVTDGDDYIGALLGLDTIKISVSSTGKVTLSRFDRDITKKKAMAGMATIKASGKYYVLTINGLPYRKKLFPPESDWGDSKQAKKISTSKLYRYQICLDLNMWPDDNGKSNKLRRDVSAFYFLDNMTVNASRKITLDMAKWNYTWFDSWVYRPGSETQPQKKLAVFND